MQPKRTPFDEPGRSSHFILRSSNVHEKLVSFAATTSPPGGLRIVWLKLVGPMALPQRHHTPPRGNEEMTSLSPFSSRLRRARSPDFCASWATTCPQGTFPESPGRALATQITPSRSCDAPIAAQFADREHSGLVESHSDRHRFRNVGASFLVMSRDVKCSCRASVFVLLSPGSVF